MKKILYFGTICNLSDYEKILEQCHSKPTVATVVFETALLDGLIQNGANVEIHSFPMIPTFPDSKFLYFGGKKEHLPFGVDCHWLRTVNLPFIKQMTRRLDAGRALRKWVKNNGNDGVIFTYSIPPFLVKDILKYAKKYRLKTVAIVPDLLRDMYVNEKQGTIISQIKNFYLNSALHLQSDYDGYIYLTDAMREVVAPDKPYMVMEGIADISGIETTQCEEKALPRAVMYAGMLYEKYGIFHLIDAFEQIEAKDAELWLFGDGPAVDEIKRRAANNTKIRFFGKVGRDEILKRERQATLLVNPRSVKEEFTKYSFPSKTIEYMLSATPVLTTKLQGIPEEYFQYVFSAEDNNVPCLTDAMNRILSNSNDYLAQFGKRAQAYVVNEKNAKIQTKRILDFINEV